MLKFAALAMAALMLAGCEQCTSPATVNAGVGVGTGGVRGGVSVGRSCGPGHISLGVGNSYHIRW